MFKNKRGVFHLFEVFGIHVWLHWSWFLVAIYAFETRKNSYLSPVWMVAEYLSLFGIVLLHEFGHALACKQTGGEADEIVLWPLGGIAFVRPPNRPGAILWSIAAGPLVNVVLIPILYGLNLAAVQLGLFQGNPDLHRFLGMVTQINFVLLIFNILPIYPLDGGQILRSLLWFLMGPGKSLYVVVVIGFLGAIALAGYGVLNQFYWFCLLALFMGSRCWEGFKEAKSLNKIQAMRRHESFACPECGEAPFAGNFWTCNHCQQRFDTFETRGKCPQCAQEFETTNCPLCRQPSPMEAWRRRV